MLDTGAKGPYFGRGWLFSTPQPPLGRTRATKPGGSPRASGILAPASFLLPLFQHARRPWVTLACPCPRCPCPYPSPAQHRDLPPPSWGASARHGPGTVALPSAMAVLGDSWPGRCHKWHMKGHPQTPPLLIHEEIRAFVVLRKTTLGPSHAPLVQTLRCHQAGLMGMCGDPHPAKPALVPAARPGGHPRWDLQVPGTAIRWWQQDGTRVVSLG